jgi:hypothetical protein
MILTITLILSFLVAVNFFLLIFSCNKTTQKGQNKRPYIIRNQKSATNLVPNQLHIRRLAATGS